MVALTETKEKLEGTHSMEYTKVQPTWNILRYSPHGIY
jgi:hypothetical protein